MNQENSYFGMSIFQTLSNASEHPFYKSHWGTAITDKFKRLSDGEISQIIEIFNGLPHITRNMVQKELHLFLQSGDQLLLMGQTSGTTSEPMWWYTTEQEFDLTRKIFNYKTDKSKENKSTKIGIKICPPVHSVPNPRFNVGDDAYFFDASIADDSSFDRFLHLLQKKYDVKNFESEVSVLAGPAPVLAAITQTMIDCGLRSQDFAVKALQLYGAYTNKYHKHLLTEYWNAPLLDNYSLSEIPRARGAICPKCGYLMFSPNLHTAVVGLDNDLPIHSGVGRIVLTTLWPSKLGQPFVKYVPGDIVEFLTSETACCYGHENGVRLLGRLHTSVSRKSASGGVQIIINSHQIRDILFSPEVSKLDQFPSLYKLTNRTILGRPRAKIPETIDSKNSLDIKYVPSNPGRPNPEELYRSFLSVSHELSRAVAQDGLKFILTPVPDLEESIGK